MRLDHTNSPNFICGNAPFSSRIQWRIQYAKEELGRVFRPDEDSVPGRDAVVVLGHELWSTELFSDRNVVGRTVFLNNVPFTVIGVAPEPVHRVEQA